MLRYFVVYFVNYLDIFLKYFELYFVCFKGKKNCEFVFIYCNKMVL